MKTNLAIITVSLFVTSLISCLCAVCGTMIMGTFWGWFWLAFLVQLIGFIAWNSYLLQKERAIRFSLELQELETMSKFVVRLSCAYCNQQHDVPIRLNVKNSFKCSNCTQTNGVHMQFSATQVTTPIESVKISLPDEQDSVKFQVTR